MITAGRLGVLASLMAGLTLGGCAGIEDDLKRQWSTAFVMAPAEPHRKRQAIHHTKVSTARCAPVPGAEPAAESAAVKCARKLYVYLAASPEDLKAREAECHDAIVNQPIGVAP